VVVVKKLKMEDRYHHDYNEMQLVVRQIHLDFLPYEVLEDRQNYHHTSVVVVVVAVDRDENLLVEMEDKYHLQS
jgi:hypothetical protein